MTEEKITDLWVFGYGSLCWNPGFTYGQRIDGSVTGFARRFYQGNTTHRGVPGKPGRVATLVEEPDQMTYGCAFQVVGEDASLNYLNQREVKLGGYISHTTQFQPKDLTVPPISVLLYRACPVSNEQWMGPEKLDLIAEQIVSASGASGHNVEYVLRLADWMRDTFPDVVDVHLYTLEMVIRKLIKERNLDLESMMNKEIMVTEECLGKTPKANASKRLSRPVTQKIFLRSFSEEIHLDFNGTDGLICLLGEVDENPPK